jgi:hypothetical protein
VKVVDECKEIQNRTIGEIINSHVPVGLRTNFSAKKNIGSAASAILSVVSTVTYVLIPFSIQLINVFFYSISLGSNYAITTAQH